MVFARVARKIVVASMNTFRAAAVLALLGYAVPAWSGPSVYRTAPDDPRAITVRATGDGVADDSAAIQQEVGRIDVPARPLQLLFGGKDRRTLFILTHHALYAAQP